MPSAAPKLKYRDYSLTGPEGKQAIKKVLYGRIRNDSAFDSAFDSAYNGYTTHRRILRAFPSA